MQEHRLEVNTQPHSHALPPKNMFHDLAPFRERLKHVLVSLSATEIVKFCLAIRPVRTL